MSMQEISTCQTNLTRASGIGDQGVGAVLISVAKLALYTLCAGINPRRTLPVVLDVGTDNETLSNDPLYLGLRRPRVRGKDYDAFIQRFLQACRKRYPKAYIHFEDFGLKNARMCVEYNPYLRQHDVVGCRS